MTAHDPALQWPEDAPPAHFAAARPLVRPLAMLAAASVIAAGGVFALLGPARPPTFAAFASPGLAGSVGGSLLLAALGLAACLAITRMRQRGFARRDGLAARISQRQSARWPGILLTLAFTAAAAGLVLADWPVPTGAAHTPVAGEVLAAAGSFTVASALLLLATPWLLAERYFAAVTPEACRRSKTCGHCCSCRCSSWAPRPCCRSPWRWVSGRSMDPRGPRRPVARGLRRVVIARPCRVLPAAARQRAGARGDRQLPGRRAARTRAVARQHGAASSAHSSAWISPAVGRCISCARPACRSCC